jgi:hypothetical protein
VSGRHVTLTSLLVGDLCHGQPDELCSTHAAGWMSSGSAALLAAGVLWMSFGLENSRTLETNGNGKFQKNMIFGCYIANDDSFNGT